MAHLKSQFVRVVDPESLPSFVSSHKGLLKPYGGDLKSLHDLHEPPRSRNDRTVTKKDFQVNGQRRYRKIITEALTNEEPELI